MNRSLFLLVPALALAAAGCTDTASHPLPADEPVAVRVAPVVRERLALPVEATGTLGPKEDLTLAFKVGGVVSSVLVHEGDRVRAGQLLAALDPGEIEPAVTRARAAAEKAERDWARARRLYADSVVTQQQLDDASTAREAARAEFEAAVFNRSHARIVAPAAGVILRRQAEPGEVVAAGTPVVALGSRARGQVVRAGIADRDAVRLHLGDAATVRFDALPGRAFEGRVSEIGAAADPATGTYRVEIALPGAAELASGLVGAVEIRPRAVGALPVVPVESVLEADGGSAVVYVLAPGGRRVERRAVAIAFQAGERVAVRSGLEGATAVVTDGAGRLSPGDRVEVSR